MRTVIVATALALLLAPGLVAQSSGNGGAPGSGGGDISVSESELESFASALEDIQSIRQDMNSRSQAAVQDSELNQKRFQELYRAQQGGQSPSEPATDAESQQLEELIAEIRQIQKESNEEMVAAVEEEGLSVSRFNRIAQAVQQSPELRKRLNEVAGGGGAQS
jgi:hypothetical protein